MKSQPPAPPSSGERGVRALVIDDSELARSMISALLTEAGFEVLTQPSAIGATRTILQNHVRVVVVDVSMPGLSGDKLVGVLRANSRLSGLVVIVVSAKPEVELSRIAAETAADAVLSKSELPARLLPLLSRLLRFRQGLSSTGASRAGGAA